MGPGRRPPCNLHQQGDAFHGASYNGGPGYLGDPQVNDLLGRLGTERDNNKIKDA